MRKLVFFVCIFYLLYNGGNNTYANSFQEKICLITKEKVSKNEQTKFTEDDQNMILFEETDLDFEEELNNDNSKDLSKDNFSVKKSNFIKSFYNSESKLFVLNYFNNRFEIFSPFSGYSNPIYISIQVLRI
jgi:hypothetical protein